ncbi:MAG TPA: hypothetical protein VNJ54_15615 [Plantibacter sp.]|uniref:hypothetical protein n=1 Tax=unclassified Plantibacter TaxID=2624265 RepID=UPI002B5C31C5|nr:hypothetical protein [Plantibacter sp.]
MKTTRIGLTAGASLTAAVLLCTTAAPAFASAPSEVPTDAKSVTMDAAQTTDLTPEEAALAKTVDQLTAGVDQATLTYDARTVPAEVASSETGQEFAAEFARSGGTVIAADGTSTAPAAQDRQAVTAAAAQGRIWQDAWGVHMTVPKDTMDRLATLAATGSAGAGAIAGLLAVNIEGFPISTTGALASGAVAVGLIAAAGALQVCNINGNGAQLNYNWILWTCWPL